MVPSYRPIIVTRVPALRRAFITSSDSMDVIAHSVLWPATSALSGQRQDEHSGMPFTSTYFLYQGSRCRESGGVVITHSGIPSASTKSTSACFGAVRPQASTSRPAASAAIHPFFIVVYFM